MSKKEKGVKKDSKNLLKEEEEKLQAVLLADSFDTKLLPLTSERPRSLLKVCNLPLIEYSLEMLIKSQVQEIFIVACYQAEKIKNYINNSKWVKSGSSVTVQVIITQQLLSVGDALREIDRLSIIRSDFVLLSGDVVSNMNLQSAIEAHKARKESNPNAIMTMIVKPSSLTHPTRLPDSDPVYVLDANSHECLYYEPLNAFPQPDEIAIPLETIDAKAKGQDLEIRKDLVDCFIDICSVEVPALFTENFDYQHLRKDFVYGVLTSDLLGKSIHCHILDKYYASRVSGPKLYAAVSLDIMGRWTYPLVPDSNLLGDTTYTYDRRQIYKEEGVDLARSCVLERRVVVGEGSRIGANSKLIDTVIGKNCIIGDNVHLNQAFISDNVTIENNCSISTTIIGNDVKILSSVTINKGCLIADECQIGPDTIIPEFTKLTLSTAGASGDTPSPYGDNVAVYEDVLSDDGGQDSDEESNSSKNTKHNFLLTQLAREWSDLSPIAAVEDLLTDKSEAEESDEEIDELEEEDRRALEFEREARSTVERAIKEGLSIDNAVLELTSLRMSYNAQFIQVRECIIPQLLTFLDKSKPLDKALGTLFKRWAPLISKFTISEYDMIDAIDIFMASCADSPAGVKMFPLGLHCLYELDVFSEDAILQWYESDDNDRLEDRAAEYKKLRASAKPFVDWLNEAEEDSD